MVVNGYNGITRDKSTSGSSGAPSWLITGATLLFEASYTPWTPSNHLRPPQVFRFPDLHVIREDPHEHAAPGTSPSLNTLGLFWYLEWQCFQYRKHCHTWCHLFTTNQYQLQHFDREYFGDLGETEYLKSKPKHHLVGGLNPFEKYARQIGSWNPQAEMKIKNVWTHQLELLPCLSKFLVNLLEIPTVNWWFFWKHPPKMVFSKWWLSRMSKPQKHT